MEEEKEVIASPFDAELQRLLTKELTDEQELIARRYYSQKEREGMDESSFCGPHKSFPITSQADVDNAAHLVGHADNPAAVKACIKGKAKAHGWSLPDSWQDEDKESEDRAEAVDDSENIERDWAKYDAQHEHKGTHHHAHHGTHTHHHTHHDGTHHRHAHTHTHEGHHHHAHHAKPRAEGSEEEMETIERAEVTETAASEKEATPVQALAMYAPITRIDSDQWIIEGQATSEAVDSYGTIFEYESSKKAFQAWMARGNIREQHDPRKAVGKALAVEFDDDNKVVYVRARISKGARDTWEKIQDGTLSGFSISAYGDAKVRQVERSGKQVPMYYDHRLAELSVVDAPGSPNCDIRPVVRADGVITDLIDDVVEESEVSADTKPVERAEETPQVERAGARVSADTKSKMHDSIGHTLHAAMSQMQNCGCDECTAAMKHLDPDGDGDIDLGGYSDPDNDADELYSDASPDDDEVERRIEGLIERAVNAQLAPVYARLQAVASTLARVQPAAPVENKNIPTPDYEGMITTAITRALEAGNITAMKTGLDEVRAEMSAVKDQVDKIAETPVPGAPIMNAGSMPRPVDKRLPTDPYEMPRTSGSAVADAVAALYDAGRLDTTEKQVDAVAAALAAQRRRG